VFLTGVENWIDGPAALGQQCANLIAAEGVDVALCGSGDIYRGYLIEIFTTPERS